MSSSSVRRHRNSDLEHGQLRPCQTILRWVEVDVFFSGVEMKAGYYFLRCCCGKRTCVHVDKICCCPLINIRKTDIAQKIFESGKSINR